jgi:hypothetical protein
VSRALDAATLELTDGRRVRLLGVIAPAAGSCPASAATAAANSLTAGQKVILISQPGAGADPFGQAWVYAQLGDPMGNDLGQILAVGGWVAEYPESPASPEYQSTLTGRVDQAEATHVGAWGPPCGPALPDSTTTPASDSGRDIDVHVWHHDDHKSRFCRRHWYC